MSTNERTTVATNGWLWLGAAIAITEIMTGTYFAPLGWGKGLLAILIGHIIGCGMLFLAGRIGAQTSRSAMNTMKIAFGEKGGLFFSILNVIQLVGWTAVMIATGASAMNVLIGKESGSTVIGAFIIAALILIWMLFGPKTFGRVNNIVVIALTLLCLFLTWRVATTGLSAADAVFDDISFGAAVELAVAMPLSWLPVISDYTSRAEKPVLSNTVSNITYFLGSCWMFVIGLGCAIATGYADISLLMRAMGMGAIGLVIIIFSTITSSFLDARSAAISFTTLSSKPSERTVAVIVCIIGFAIAIFDPTSSYQDFLYLIGSFFTPMVGVLLTEYYILKQKDVRNMVSILNFVVYIIGFLLYRELLNVDIITGTTLPVVIIVGILTYIANKAFAKH